MTAIETPGSKTAAAAIAEASRKDAHPDDPLPFVQAAVSLLAQGDASGALFAASEACHRAPNLPQAHYAYGQAFAALGAPARAEQAFAAAIKLQPRWADAWINYGVARYRQGFIEDAKKAMRQALAADPQNAVAASNLGAFMRISGEAEGAERLLRAQLDDAPEAAGVRLNIVADLLQEERAGEALALLQQASPPAGDLAAARHWRLQEALALLQLRRPAEARAAIEAFETLRPVSQALEPLLLWRKTLLAALEGDGRKANETALRMEEALGRMGPDAVAEHAIMAHYDLAKYWSGQNQHARAFAHWTAGHKALSRFQPFSRDAHRAFVDASIEAFSKARLNDGPRALDRDPAPVFVVGMPRSGTTLVEQILGAHRDTHGAGERTALGQAFARLGGGADADAARRIAALDADALTRAAEAYLSELHALAPNAARIVDKMPGNFLYLGLAALMLPGAKVISCARDPRDIGLSIFTFRFHGNHGYAHDLVDLGWYIGEQQRLTAHWRSVFPTPILTIRLSDWVEHFDGTLRRVLHHVELPPDPNCARFYEQDSRVRTVSKAQVRQPVNARGLGRWRTYARELEPLIRELENAGCLDDWR